MLDKNDVQNEIRGMSGALLVKPEHYAMLFRVSTFGEELPR